MPESPLAIAGYFLQKAEATGEILTPMKVVKLVYIAHGWYLGLTQRPLITDDVEAWQYGPVVREVYHQLKKYGNSAVPAGAVPPWITITDASVEPFLDSVWGAYKSFSGGQLSTLTHQPNTPWDITWNQRGGKHLRGAIIEPALIQKHYQEKASRG